MPPFLVRFRRRVFSPAGIAISYAVVGSLWILFSDRLLPAVTGSVTVEQLTRLQTTKGVLYIALTAGFIYILIRIGARTAHASELAREEIRSRYEQIFLHTGAVVLITEADTGTILEANPAAIKFYGWPREELLGKNLVELTVQSDEQMRGEVEAAAVEGRDFLLIRHRIASGEIRDVAMNATPITTPRRTLDYLLIYDLTRQRDLENQLRHAQKMEAVGQLTGGIAHDLNNVLTVVLADADLLAEQLPQHGLDMKEDLDDLRGAARRGAAMIRKLLSFSRANRLSLANVDLGPAIAELASVVKRMMPENIVVAVQNHEAGRVLVDTTALEQIVFNLATNSRDALPRGGTIRLETGRTVLKESEVQRWIRRGTYVYLKVSDDGVGMDDRTRSRMFEPFFTTRPASEGAGLGMAMVYGLVKQHEGFIMVESTVGKGTTVTVYLPPAPVFEVTGPEPMAPAASSRRRGGEMILVVEDEQALQRAAQRILERLGYRVMLAPNGEVALEVLEQRGDEVDLVISDMSMPRLGGPELFNQARARGHTMRFLFSSGYAPAAQVAMPDVPFLAKPWTYDELATKVKEVLGRP